MRVTSFAFLASLLALLPFSSAVSASGSIKQPEDVLGEDAQALNAFQQQALDTTFATLDAEEERLKKRGETASCTRQNLEIRLD